MEGVVTIPLKQIPDERGKLMHMLRCDPEEIVRIEPFSNKAPYER